MNEIEKEEIKEYIREAIEEIFFSEDEFSPFNNLQGKVNKLLDVAKYEERLDYSIRVCDKFEDYMKNIDKLNILINEFKGLVALLRGEFNVRK
jgi:hypothetical protein